jgi:hypothetical protein
LIQPYYFWVKESRSAYYSDTCIPMYTRTLFTTAKLWIQPTCPSMNEWIKKMYIYTMEFYSAINKNKYMLFSGK